MTIDRSTPLARFDLSTRARNVITTWSDKDVTLGETLDFLLDTDYVQRRDGLGAATKLELLGLFGTQLPASLIPPGPTVYPGKLDASDRKALRLMAAFNLAQIGKIPYRDQIVAGYSSWDCRLVKGEYWCYPQSADGEIVHTGYHWVARQFLILKPLHLNLSSRSRLLTNHRE